MNFVELCSLIFENGPCFDIQSKILFLYIGFEGGSDTIVEEPYAGRFILKVQLKEQFNRVSVLAITPLNGKPHISEDGLPIRFVRMIFDEYEITFNQKVLKFFQIGCGLNDQSHLVCRILKLLGFALVIFGKWMVLVGKNR